MGRRIFRRAFSAIGALSDDANVQNKANWNEDALAERQTDVPDKERGLMYLVSQRHGSCFQLKNAGSRNASCCGTKRTQRGAVS